MSWEQHNKAGTATKPRIRSFPVVCTRLRPPSTLPVRAAAHSAVPSYSTIPPSSESLPRFSFETPNQPCFPEPSPSPVALAVRSRPSTAPPRSPEEDPLFAWNSPGARGSWLFAVLSLSLHAALVGAVLLSGSSTHSRPAARDLIDVSVEPALGVPQGSLEGRGLGSHRQVHRASTTRASPRSAGPKAPHAEPEGTLPTPAPPIAATSSSATAASAQTQDPPTPPAASADPSTPVGAENVAPAVGRPDGSENGVGTQAPKPRMTPQYAGQLAGWFGARFNVRGLGLDPEELKKLSVGVAISLSPDRRISAFALRGSSGNSAYDDEVRRTVAGIQASGIPLPEPNDGSTPPPSFSVRFRPLVIH